MIEGRGGQLDLAAGGELAVQRNHAGHQLALLGQEPLLLVFGVVAALRLEFGQVALLLEEQGVNPREVRPDLEVAQVARAKPRKRFARRRAPGRAKQVELVVAGVRPDHRIRIGHEKVVEQVAGFGAIEPVGGPARAAQVRVGRALRVGLELGEQARDQVDRAAEFGHLFQMQRHPQVVFGGVQPDPGHGVFARDVIGVVRLMLVPQERERNRMHQSPFKSREVGSRYSRYSPSLPNKDSSRLPSIARNVPGPNLSGSRPRGARVPAGRSNPAGCFGPATRRLISSYRAMYSRALRCHDQSAFIPVVMICRQVWRSGQSERARSMHCSSAGGSGSAKTKPFAVPCGEGRRVRVDNGIDQSPPVARTIGTVPCARL